MTYDKIKEDDLKQRLLVNSLKKRNLNGNERDKILKELRLTIK